MRAEEPLDKLSREQKLVLLRRLRKKLQSLVLSMEAPVAAIGIEVRSYQPIHHFKTDSTGHNSCPAENAAAFGKYWLLGRCRQMGELMLLLAASP